MARVHTSVLAAGERRLLTAIASRLPSPITPDHLTLCGVVGGVLVGVGCVASCYDFSWLSLAIVGLGLNWFGDSLDGSLARLRGIERPRYGFFVDQFSDVVSHFLILIGMGLSPLMQLETALLALLGSLLTMFYGHLSLPFKNSWQVSHYGVGPTELRVLIAAGMILVMLADVPTVTTAFGPVTIFDAVGFLVFLAAIACVLIMFKADRAKLARIDPPRGRPPAEVSVIELPAPETYGRRLTANDAHRRA
ncbi:MAG: CDP-alcohol phosphatidyltransferase family protein [Hyphomicrobiaceae bacterium]